MRRLLLITLLCVSLQQAFGWGDEGHKAINRAAARRIPASMPAFLQASGPCSPSRFPKISPNGSTVSFDLPDILIELECPSPFSSDSYSQAASYL